MSIFLEFPCTVAGTISVLSVKWCAVERICAVVTSNHCVSFYLEDGIALTHCRIVRRINATDIAWHPRNKTIASGWEDGHIAIWGLSAGPEHNTSTCIFAADSKSGHTPIRVVVWNTRATRLLSGDASGLVMIWKADTRGSLLIFKEFSVGSAVTSVVFAPPSMSSARMNFPAIFIGSRSGSLHSADDMGHASEVQTLGARIDHMLFFEKKSRLIVLTRALALVQLQIGSDGKVIPVMRMKVAVAGGATERGIRNVCWVGPEVIAAATGEALIRFWNLVNDETYVVALSSAGMSRNSRASSIAFNSLQRYLAVGTCDGKVAMWCFAGEYQAQRRMESHKSPNDEYENKPKSSSQWKAIPCSTCKSIASVDVIAWGPGHGVLATASADGSSSILSETVLHRLLQADVGMIQISTDSVRVERQNGFSAILNSDVSIRGVAASSDHVLLWNGQEVHVYEWSTDMGDSQPVLRAKFPSVARCMVLRAETIFRALQNVVELCNIHGIVRQKITFSEREGSPTHLDVNGDYLAVATDTGLIKVFQVTRREPKQLGSPGHFNLWAYANDDLTGSKLNETSSRISSNDHAIRSIRCNADGTRVSILADRVHGGTVQIREPDSRLHVYDSERDIIDSYDFANINHFPTSHYWDLFEPKLLACETHRVCVTYANTNAEKFPIQTSSMDLHGPREAVESAPLVEVATMFVTADYGILLQDSFALEPPLQALLGVQVPRLFFSRCGGDVASMQSDEKCSANQSEVGLCSRVMRDFIGLDDAEAKTRSALLDFSFFLTVGNMDEAHCAVRLIETPSVWENMAHMCVKTKRLDVAEVCLGHMGHARGAAAVRTTKIKVLELGARIAAVAVQLGLRNDAARLYRECQRFDLLNRLYQAAGEWELAIDLASCSDRIHFRSTHHRYAQHLEALGSYDAAARHYELAQTHRREIPRMLVARGEQSALERYVMRADDTDLMKWWAGYCESLGHLDSARHCYESAGDHYSLVRVACFANEADRAGVIVNESRSTAGAYHLARHLEGRGDISEAIQYFAKSGCYNHAIRLARQYQLDTDLMQFSLKASPSLQVDCAHYFEHKGEFEKAVQLYQKGGELAKALDLCFKVGGAGRTAIFEVLANISDDLKQSASPAVMARCAEFFVEHGQYEKAVNLYIAGGRYARAINLCSDHHVTITDELAEALTPVKAAKNNRASSEEERVEVLLELARVCKKQNSYQLACKKFTQAGDRARALKCLLRSGDTKSIIYYASISRQREIYILAANYLQSLDWQSGSDSAAELTRKIVEFYTKARAHESLAAFYDAYAQMEIDEFRDYEKALGALKESREHLERLHKATDREERVRALEARMNIISDFVEIRRCEQSDPQKMVKMCTALLQRHDVEAAIRIGDAYALLIEHHFKANSAHVAFALVQQMRQRRIVLHPYLERGLLEQLYAAVGEHLPSGEDDTKPVTDESAVKDEFEDVERDGLY